MEPLSPDLQAEDLQAEGPQTEARQADAMAPVVAEAATDAPVVVLSPDEAKEWRGELSARLNRYRERHKAPPPRYPSLRLPFDPLEARSGAMHLRESALVPTFEPLSNQALALDGMRADAAPEELAALPSAQAHEVRPPREPVSHPTAKIIEFPRFAWGPPPAPPDQLAEPVGEQLRILEVPEAVPPPPALGGITIEPVQKEEPEKRPGIDIPLQSAPLGRRMLASLVDGVIVAAASALFGFIVWKITEVRPPGLQLLGFSAAVLCLSWAAYQYLLIVYTAGTPGLRIAELELTRFDGTPATRSVRRWRVLASYLSAASLGMGYAWVFLDEDVLCWHDRITHTYLAPRK
ncbi:MAG: RDD family protein [Candidatus Sulfotelmatobacter sp.]